MRRLNQKETKAALAAGKVKNADCATPGAVDLPDGNPEAERVSVYRNKRTGQDEMLIGCPWLLCNVFSL